MSTATTEFNQWSDRFHSLSTEESENIVAGESLLYWFAYGVGITLYTLAHSSGTQSSGQKLANAALS